MNRTFHSKVDWWYWLLMAVTAFLLFDFFWFHYYAATFVVAMLMIFEIEMLVHTHYIVSSDGEVCIKSGRFVPGRTLLLKDIERMDEVTSYVVAPALSSHRVEICFREGGKLEKIQVSPQNCKEFMQWVEKKK